MVSKNKKKISIKIPSNALIKQRNKIVFKEVNNRIYFLNPEKEEFHTLNKTASFIFRLTRQPVSIKKIVNELKKNFSFSIDNEQEIEKDVKSWIKKYFEAGFLELVSNSKKK